MCSADAVVSTLCIRPPPTGSLRGDEGRIGTEVSNNMQDCASGKTVAVMMTSASTPFPEWRLDTSDLTSCVYRGNWHIFHITKTNGMHA